MAEVGRTVRTPAELRIRAYAGDADLPAMHRVHQATARADGIDKVTTLEQFRLGYATLVNCDPAHDILVGEVAGEIVAYARVFWQDLVEGGRQYDCHGWIDPAWRRRGIGGALHRRNEARLLEIAAGHPGVEPKWLASESVETNTGAGALLRRSGYEPVRWFHEMVAPTLEPIVATPLPDGVEIRPVDRGAYRTIWEAENEAFRDHWGEAEWSEEDWVRTNADPQMADPSLWRVGWDGDEVAGAVVTTVPQAENELHGRRRVYVAGVSVRRPWRRRGLARALLSASLVAARDAGFTSASLGVDTDSPTGAPNLYRSLGFVPEQTFVAWRKPLG